MKKTDILCRDCEQPIGPNIIDTKKPCYHILISEFTETKRLGHQTDSFMLCKKCFNKRMKKVYLKKIEKEI